MARFPTVEDLGARPTPRSERNVVSFRGDIADNAAAQGFEQQAEIAKKIGLDVDNMVQGLQRQGLAKARSTFLAGKVEMDGRYALDQDFKTAPDRYTKELNQLRDKSGEGLFGETLGAFQSQSTVDIAQGVERTKVIAFDKNRNHNLAELAGLLDTNRSALLTASDSVTRESILNATKDSIRSMKEQGFLNEVEAGKMSREFSIDYAVSRITMMAPQDQHRALAVPKGWSSGDQLPARKKDGSPTDLIPEDVRVEMARKAMPGVNARVAIDETDRIEAAGGDITSKLAEAGKIANPVVQKEVIRSLKENFAFNEALKAREVEGTAQDLLGRLSDVVDYGARIEAAKTLSDDPEVTKRLIDLVDADNTRTLRMEAGRDKAQFDAASAKAYRNEPLEEADLAGLDSRQRNYVEKAAQEAALEAADPDYRRTGDGGATWQRYVFDSGDVTKFAAMTERELKTKYELGVTKTQFEDVILPYHRSAVQAVAGRKPDTAAGPSGMTEQNRIDTSALKVGINKKNDEKKYMAWRGEYDRRVMADGATKDADKQKILDEMVKEIVVYDKSDVWLSGDDEAALGTMTDAQKKTFAKDAGIPTDQREVFADSIPAIADSLRRQGLAVNRENILAMWAQALKNLRAAP